jgi:predicted nucleic acid-binding protein
VILVDTSVWVDHLHESDSTLVGLLDTSSVLSHPMVVGELALGSLRERSSVLAALSGLPWANGATHHEVMTLVEQRKLFGIGLSLDAHLLASVLVTARARLWTRDKRLHAVAAELGLSFAAD